VDLIFETNNTSCECVRSMKY